MGCGASVPVVEAENTVSSSQVNSPLSSPRVKSPELAPVSPPPEKSPELSSLPINNDTAPLNSPLSSPSVKSPELSPVKVLTQPLLNTENISDNESPSPTPSARVETPPRTPEPVVSPTRSPPSFKKPSLLPTSRDSSSIEVQQIKEHDERQLMRIAEKASMNREIIEEEEMKIREYESIIRREADKERRAREEEERIIRKDVEDAGNPELLSFFVVFPSACLGQSNELDETIQDQRVVYRYHLPRTSAVVMDLKLAINLDFGFSFSQQRLFYQGVELSDNILLSSLPSFDDGAYVALHPLGTPVVEDKQLVKCTKPRHVEETIGDVIRNQMVALNQTDCVEYRDWIGELIELRRLSTENLTSKIEREKKLLILRAEFEYSAQKAVAMILSNSESIKKVQLSAIYGTHGGDTWVVSGIVIRRAQNWEVLQQDIGEGELAFKAAGNEAIVSSYLHNLLDSVAPSDPLYDLFPISRRMCGCIWTSFPL
ncbi:hypothetical protein RCL1_008388 [Eukaryota sp. TZLM3-RCL]